MGLHEIQISKRAGYSRLVFAFIFGLIASVGLAAEEEDKKEPKAETTLRVQARDCEAKRQFAEAADAYTKLIELRPRESRLWHQRGVARFMAGDFLGSVEDFDTFLEKEPEQMPYHWQRGLSQYGAGLFKEGRAQFEAHQKVNSHDVENAAWHFICVARLEGVDAARKALIPIRGDQRVPMSEIYELYAGKGSEKAVIDAANQDASQAKNHLCYAHLYLALYKEALGKPTEALAHYKLAAVDYNQRHYMGETASVYYQSRLREQASSSAPLPPKDSK